MTPPTVRLLDRRVFLVRGGAAAAAALLPLAAASATETPTPPAASSPAPGPVTATRSPQFDETLQAILKGAEPAEGALTLELPELAENGNVVPYKINVESPMTDTDYVKTLSLLSTQNPQAFVASFHLIPATGRATVSGRMRLARTQDVVALAELSNGNVLIATATIEVTIGGCGNE